MLSNHPGAADGIESLVLMQKLLATADQERYTALSLIYGVRI
jgi:hypothetical protein